MEPDCLSGRSDNVRSACQLRILMEVSKATADL